MSKTMKIVTSRDCGCDLSDDQFESYLSLATERVAKVTGYTVEIEVALVMSTQAYASDGDDEAERDALCVMQDAWQEWCSGEN